MESIIFFIAMIAVIYVVIWSIRNKDVDDDQPTHGFFRMIHKDPELGDKDEDDRRRS